jgi:haloacetate dehalogenase
MPSVGRDDDQAASPLRLPGFEYQSVDVDRVTMNCAVKGSGPPLLLLRGYPENHLT